MVAKHAQADARGVLATRASRALTLTLPSVGLKCLLSLSPWPPDKSRRDCLSVELVGHLEFILLRRRAAHGLDPCSSTKKGPFVADRTS